MPRKCFFGAYHTCKNCKALAKIVPPKASKEAKSGQEPIFEVEDDNGFRQIYGYILIVFYCLTFQFFAYTDQRLDVDGLRKHIKRRNRQHRSV